MPKLKLKKFEISCHLFSKTVDGWRVVLIEPAEALNIASSNALLKTLEEPGERIVIILLARALFKIARNHTQSYAALCIGSN